MREVLVSFPVMWFMLEHAAYWITNSLNKYFMNSDYVLGIQYQEMPNTKLYLIIVSKTQTSFENL